MLKLHNDQMTIDKIMSMTLDELQDAVIRLLSVKCVNASDWNGQVYLPDDLADAFRGRQ